MTTLSRCERAVLKHLIERQKRYGKADPTIQQVSDAVAYGLTMVRSALAKLEKDGYITTIDTPHVNSRSRHAPLRVVNDPPLKSKNALLTSKETLLTSKNSDAPYIYEPEFYSAHKYMYDPPFYWQWMEYIESNTGRYIQQRAASALASERVTQLEIFVSSDPELAQAFEWE